jgi:hypothetical protein
MKNKISKKFLILIVSTSLLITTGIILACGGEDFSDFYNSFFAPETSNTPESKPFYRSSQTFYDYNYFGDTINTIDTTNLYEWKTFFAQKVSAHDLKFLIYQSRIGEIDTCIYFIKNDKFPIKKHLLKNSLLSIEDKALAKEFLFYLGFAKRCEPFSTYSPEGWNDGNKEDLRSDVNGMNKLVNGGEKAMINVKSPFIKERYAYQVTRLLFQSGQYEACIDFYNQNNNLFTSKNSILYRTMGYVAASQYKLKNYSAANYMYAVIYDHCEPMKISSFESFHPQEETDWKGSLALAQNNREKEVLWQLLGISADPLRTMKEIYNLDPKSNLLDLLLVRAVNINEESFVPGQGLGPFDKIDSGYALHIQKVDKELFDFSQKAADDGNTNKPYLWDMVVGYLNLAQGHYKQAGKYLSKAEAGSKGDVLVNEQIRAFRLMSKIEQYTKADPKTEGDLAKELFWLGKEKRHPSLRTNFINNWALGRLSEKYRRWGDSVKAQCLDYNQNKQFYGNPKNMEALIAFMDQPSKTDFEKLILEIHPYSKATLFNYKAILLIYQYKFKEALEIIEACPGAGDGTLLADPFVIHIYDCHDCDFLSKKEQVYSLHTFVKRLKELQEKVLTDPKNAPKYYFLLANGLYNMTYYGNARSVYASPILNIDLVYFEYNRVPQNNPFFDCSKAMEYYQKAMEASTDKEFKAKCCFMAAKCEQNQYFSSPEFDYNKIVRSGTYFAKLRDNFSKTKYYKEIIDECGYFKMYASEK